MAPLINSVVLVSALLMLLIERDPQSPIRMLVTNSSICILKQSWFDYYYSKPSFYCRALLCFLDFPPKSTTVADSFEHVAHSKPLPPSLCAGSTITAKSACVLQVTHPNPGFPVVLFRSIWAAVAKLCAMLRSARSRRPMWLMANSTLCVSATFNSCRQLPMHWLMCVLSLTSAGPLEKLV